LQISLAEPSKAFKASASVNQVDRRWLNGFMAAGFHGGLISLTELKLEYMKAHRNA
jgi:hypothetical protein|tara:strand:- start:3397 stop:3564 length:168 start_codon:yes stop_codon:yes gene_type:complete